MSDAQRVPYFLPDMLRQPLESVRTLQDGLLRRMVEICYDAHPFYARMMRRERIAPRHIQGCGDLVRLPPATKVDFLADPDAFRLDPAKLPAHEGTLWKVVYTTGTTSGRPAPVYVTAHDHFAYMFGFKDRQDMIGLRETDRLMNLFPLTNFPLGAFARAADEVAAIGASIVFGHTGRADMGFPLNRSLDDAVAAITRHRVTVLWGVAGFVRRVLIRAKDLGADLTSVRMVMTTGEAASPAMRADFRRRMADLGCAETVVVNRYGSTEQGGTMIECCDGSGFHSVLPDQLFHEIVDPAGGNRLGDGETGHLAVSHLNRRGTVFLRYLVGDVASLDHAPCPHCGRTSVRMSSAPVRTGDIVKIRGALVNLGNLKSEFDRKQEIDEYQIVVRPQDEDDAFSMDELVIRLAPAQNSAASVAEQIAAEVMRLTNLRPRIEIVDRDEIFNPLTASKPRRIVDARPQR